MAGEAMTFSINRVAGTTGLAACGAAQVWAATTGHELVGALNIKAGNPVGQWKPLQAVLNQLAGTTGLAVDAAARALTGPSQVGVVTPTPGIGQVALAWSAPAAGSQPITDYKVEYKQNSSGTWLVFADPVTSATGATVTGLTAATLYDFRVSAVTLIGTGSPSATVSATPS